MKNFKQRIIGLTLIAFACFSYNALSQVGVGTITPDASSMLDVSSTTKGVLTPRMTSAQRIAISSPANGLLVYDTTDNAFYFYKSSAWAKIDSKVRDNYKLIKSDADLSAELTAGGGTKYLLTANTLYEINGTITLAQPIDLNNAYLMGLDTNEDVLVKTGGTMFTGTTGGSIRNLTLSASGATVFNLTGTSTEDLIIRDSTISNSTSVGSIDGYGVVLLSMIQFSGNTTGITYNNIADLQLSNLGWLSSNSGTYETFTGTFDSVDKQGGFSEIDGAAIGVDVSSNPAVSNGILNGTTFFGTSTQYVDGYTVGAYSGYNFDKNWIVNCLGISAELDQVATGSIYFDGTITSGFVQTVTNATPINLAGDTSTNTTTAVNVMRMSSPQDNRLTYLGNQTRVFQITAALSLKGDSGTGDNYAFFIRKNGTTSLTQTNTLFRVNNTTDITNQSISGTVELAPNDYIEIWIERLTGSGSTSVTVYSLNINLN